MDTNGASGAGLTFMDDIRTDYSAWTNSMGFVTNGKGPTASSGNDLLFTGEARLIRKAQGAWTETDQHTLLYSINVFSRIEDGLYGRPGWRQDAEDCDDYYALATIDPSLARAILTYGRKHWWYFNTSPNAKWWEPAFIRFPAFIAHVTWAAGEKPNWLLRVWWAFTVAYSGSRANQDSWALSWLLVSVAGQKGWLENWAARKNFARRTAIWGSLRSVFAAYFGTSEHPNCKYCLE